MPSKGFSPLKDLPPSYPPCLLIAVSLIQNSYPFQEEVERLQIVYGTVAGLVIFVLWFILAMRPVVPEADWVLARLLQWCLMVLSLAVCAKDSGQETEDVQVTFTLATDAIAFFMGILYWILDKMLALDRWWGEVKGPQYLKILLAYMQVLGAFTMFSVEWPPQLLFIIVGIKGLIKLDIFSFSAFACLGTGVGFQSKVIAYTLAPLCITVLIFCPVPVAWLRGYSDHLHQEHSRSVLVQDRFWTNLMFMLFVLYPTLALSTMLSWQCDPLTGMMTEDFRLVCPTPDSFISMYSAGAFLLYPFGIPLFMNIALRYNNIQTIVADKVGKANFEAMLALYCKRTCPPEAQCFARLVGSADKETDLEEFKRQARHAFQKIIRLQQIWGINPEKGKEEVHLDKLLAHVIDQRQKGVQKQEAKDSGGEHAMTGVSVFDLCTYMKKHDENGDGSIDFDEFMVMLEEARSLTSIFTGSEKAPPLDKTLDQSETLSDFQIESLLLYKWPDAHNSSDFDESEGLSGIHSFVKGSKIGKKTPKDLSKIPIMMNATEDRRANISAIWIKYMEDRSANISTLEGIKPLKKDFDRQDQQLVSIANLVDVLKKLEEEKQLPPWYEKHDWKEEILEALELYIEDTDGRTTSEPNAPSEKLKPLLKAIQVRIMSKKEKLEALYKMAATLVQEGVTAIPPLVWSKPREVDDKDIVHVIDGLQKLHVIDGLQKDIVNVIDDLQKKLSPEEKKEIKELVTVYEAEKLAEEQGDIVREIKKEMKANPESHTQEERDAEVKDLEQRLKDLEQKLEQGDTNGRKPSKHSASSEKFVHTRALLRSSQTLVKLVTRVQQIKQLSLSLDETRAQRDTTIINRLGFLFVAYRVEFWFEFSLGFHRSSLTP